jgi:hypothetical protein
MKKKALTYQHLKDVKLIAYNESRNKLKAVLTPFHGIEKAKTID